MKCEFGKYIIITIPRRIIIYYFYYYFLHDDVVVLVLAKKYYSALELEHIQLQEQNQGVDNNLKREIQFQKRLINELKGEKDSM